MEQGKEWGANVKVGFDGRGKTRVGQDGVKTKDIVVGGEIQSEAVYKGGGDDQGCDGELCGSGSGGEFNSHWWWRRGFCQKKDARRGSLMRETRRTKRVFILLEEFLGMREF